MPNKQEGDDELFSVCQFFSDGSYEYIKRHVSAKEAIDTFRRYTTNVAAKIGMTQRVIITDSWDYINFEWQFKKGLTYPDLRANPMKQEATPTNAEDIQDAEHEDVD